MYQLKIDNIFESFDCWEVERHDPTNLKHPRIQNP